jgi:hypothetical protein
MVRQISSPTVSAGKFDLERRQMVGRWREDEIREGQLFRHRKYELLGTKAQFAKRRMALRVLENRISSINNLAYSPRTVASFKEFADRWMSTVMIRHKPSTRAMMRSHINKYLIAAFGAYQFRDIEAEEVQRFIAGLTLGVGPGKRVLAKSKYRMGPNQSIEITSARLRS